MEELKLIKLRDDLYLLEIEGKDVMVVECERSTTPRSFILITNPDFDFKIHGDEREDKR